MKNKKEAKDFLRTMSIKMMADYVGMAQRKEVSESVGLYLADQVSTLVVVMSILESMVDEARDDGEVSAEEGKAQVDDFFKNLDGEPQLAADDVQKAFMDEFLKGMGI